MNHNTKENNRSNSKPADKNNNTRWRIRKAQGRKQTEQEAQQMRGAVKCVKLEEK